jgi:CubicO group peptidase (beta-lactamase class C family)
MKRFLLALLLVAAGCASTRTEAPAIDRFVNDLLRDVPEAPSLGIAVVRDGKVVYLREPKTGYYIGSTTKAYTGLACAILAANGQLDLDVPVTRYLPEVTLPNAPTLRTFLTHTSGTENNGIVFRTAFSGDYTPAQLASLLNLSKRGPEGFHYSNLGYVVASLVIERVTGKPWQKVLDDLIFEPLGMHHTSAYMSEASRWPMATPYHVNRKGDVELVQLRKDDRLMHAAGGIVTSPADLARWLEANISRSGGGIPRGAFEEAQKTQTAATADRGGFKARGYGFGWYQADYKGEKALFHQGGYEGWSSAFSFLPERKIGVGIMTNASGPASRVLLLVTSHIYDVLLGKPVDGPGPASLAAFKAELAKARTAMLADVEKRSKRPWMLQHPNAAYAGQYENPAFGTIAIAVKGDHLVGSMAGLSSVLEAFTEPESARVEMIPGEGEVFRFTFTTGEKPDSLLWGTDLFKRVE